MPYAALFAGFSRVDITPPIGQPLGGWGIPAERLSQAVNDPICVRALSVRCGDQEALILAFDFCFVSREDADRFKGVLGREFGLLPAQILMNASHTHAGPGVGTYYSLYYEAPLRDYLKTVEAGAVRATQEARDRQERVRIRAGTAKTAIPLNRRCRRDGRTVNAPNPAGPILDSLPICLFEGRNGKPVALLFSASTHPVCVPGHLLSADYPGAAMAKLDKALGKPCSMFLQGAGGDTRPRLLGEGRENWNHACGPMEAKKVGQTLAKDVLKGLETALRPVKPKVGSVIIETPWPMQNSFTRADYERILAAKPADAAPSMHQRWADRQIKLLDRGVLPTSIPLLFQGIVLGEGLRVVALEGELVCEHGRAMEQAYPDGVTFALGYSNGEGLYLVTSAMLDEGGYEPESYWEFGHPAPLAKGTEEVVASGLKNLRKLGIT
jgi:hypothetical protein